MSEHALVGPSSFKRALICHASVKAIAKLPRSTNMAAAEGTALHEIAATCLIEDREPHEWVGKIVSADGYDFLITDNMAECMVAGLDWIREQPGKLFVERRVSLDPWMKGQFGTADVVILMETGQYDADGDMLYICIVFDWKFGIGIPVSVLDNVQLMGYGLGVLHTIIRPRGYKVKKFRFIIEQPRNHKGSRYHEHFDVSRRDLLAFGEELREMFDAVTGPKPRFVAGSHCHDTFCEVKDTEAGCAAYNAWQFDLIGSKFTENLDETDQFVVADEDLELLDTNIIGPARRYQIVKNRAAIIAWLAKLHSDSEAAAHAGSPDPGSKLVPGQRGDRFYVDEEEAKLILVAHLREGAYTKKMLSPTQAEAALKPIKSGKNKRKGHPAAQRALEKITDYGAAKPILVHESDARPALSSVLDRFTENLNDD